MLISMIIMIMCWLLILYYYANTCMDVFLVEFFRTSLAMGCKVYQSLVVSFMMLYNSFYNKKNYE